MWKDLSAWLVLLACRVPLECLVLWVHLGFRALLASPEVKVLLVLLAPQGHKASRDYRECRGHKEFKVSRD